MRRARRASELELSPIRDAFRDEAGDIVEVEDVELVRASSPVITSSAPSSESAETEQARPGPHARFTPGMSDAERAGEGGASRVVVLRDRRRGRPKKSTEPPE